MIKPDTYLFLNVHGLRDLEFPDEIGIQGSVLVKVNKREATLNPEPLNPEPLNL